MTIQLYPQWLPLAAHFVLVVEDDDGKPPRYECDQLGIPHLVQGGNPIVWEHRVGEGTDLRAVRQQRDSLGRRYGRVAIAKLVFVEGDEVIG